MNDITTEPRLTGRPKSSQPVPDDFARFAGVEGDLKLRTRYGVGRPVIVRWRTETGIYCGSPRGKRCASRSSVTRPKPYRSRGNPRYTPAVMTEISWYDGEDDVDTFLASSGISAWGAE